MNNNYRFVAFLDIMGFKDLVGRNTHDFVLEKLTEISKLIERIRITNEKEEVKLKYNKAELIPFIFSDSIVIFTNNSTQESVKLLLYACSFILNNSIEIHLPLKGAVAYGEITIDKAKSIFFGQPLIDAYLLQDELKYYGLILHNSVDKCLYDEKFDLNTHLFRNITPTKSGQIVYNNLKIYDKDTSLGNLYKLYNHVSGAPRIYVDNTIDMFNKWYPADKL